MTDKTYKELMQMALEALEVLTDNYDDNAVGIEIDAIIALRERLARPEQRPVEIGTEWTPCVKLPVTVHVRQQRPGETHVSTREGITPVKPDDLIMRGVSGEEYPIGREIFERTYQLGEAQTKPEQEPVAWLSTDSIGERYLWFSKPLDNDKAQPLYTAPPQREWQGAFFDAVYEAWHSAGMDVLGGDWNTFALTLEAKLKEKNT